MSEDKDASAAAGASCSPDLGGLMVQHTVDPPDVVSAPLETMVQVLDEQHNVVEAVVSCKDVELAEVILANNYVGKVPLELASPRDSLSLKILEPDIPIGGNRMPLSQTSPTLLDEMLGNFSCTAPLSLLDAPISLQIEGCSPWVGR